MKIETVKSYDSQSAWKKGETGERTAFERHQRVLPWWTWTSDGKYVFFVRAGWKPIEFERGKAAIAVPSLDKLPSIINTVIAAVRNGELDAQLASAAKPPQVQKRRAS